MRWLTRNILKLATVLAALSFLSVLVVLVPVAAVEAQPGVLILTHSAVVDVTPTVDATVTALNKEKLQHENDWWWTYGATILTSLFSTLALAAAGIFTVVRYFNDRQDAREKQEEESKRLAEDRQAEREKRAEERFQAAVEGLGSEREEAKVGAAITLRTFLRPGYEQFYIQTFDLAVAHLRLLSAPHSSKDPNTPLPLTTLREALIAVFKEAFPLARDHTSSGKEGDMQSLDTSRVQVDLAGYPVDEGYVSLQSLDASRVRLDHAYLVGADLERVYMREGMLIGANLRDANLSKAYLQRANLRGVYLRRVDLRGAKLYEADFSESSPWEADLRGANCHEVDFTKANLHLTDLRNTVLWQAKLCWADLRGAKFNGAYLNDADLSEADLSETDLEDALTLKNTNLRGAKGLTKEQLAACKAKGAIVDEDSLVSAPQSSISPPPPPQSS